jgi:two-component system, OmpR family, manganese sensing sensor histidine kinase
LLPFSGPLERRLFFSYFGAFALVTVIFALAVRFSFESIIQQQISARLEALARAGTASVELTPGGLHVNSRTLGGFNVRPGREGIEWFDPERRSIASRGLLPQQSLPPTVGRAQFRTNAGSLDTVTVAIVDDAGNVHGYVRAGETIEALQAGTRALDLGLLIASLLAIVAATIGGGILARAALAQREQSFERLRQFTADASHELRTPLAALTTTATLALREAPDLPAATHRRLTQIVTVAEQMRRVIDDLLILARAGKSLERELFIVPVDALLQRLNDANAPVAAEKALQLSVGSCGSVDIYGNPDQLDRILANLVENAIRYTEPGGSVSVSCAKDNEKVRISVRDTGIGIPAAYHQRIFDRFWRGDNVRGFDGGTGLGLAIARALAQRHGGDIMVSSEPGAGSVFTLTLPRRPPALT